MSIKHLYPTSTPSLNLNFKSSGVADPRLSCVRNSIGTYVNSSGLVKTAPANVARVEKSGLLVEESRTNHAEYSVDFTTPQWYKYYVTPNLNAGTAPDGTNTAVKLVPDAATVNRSLLDTGVNATFSGSLTVSVYAKAAEYYVFQLTIDGASAGGAFGGGAVFNVSAGTVTQGTSGIGRIEALANGWYRCSVSHYNTAQSFAVWPGISMYDNSGNSWFTANGTDGCLFWGFQLEESSFASSYIPTSGSTVQRLADFCDFPLTGWWNPSLQTWTGDFQVYTTVVNKAIVTILSGNNRPLEFVANTGSGPSQTRIGTRNPGPYAYSELTPVDRTGFNKAAGTITASKVQAYLNGNKSSSPNPITLPTGTFTTAHIGYYGTQATDQYNLNGTISRISYYPTEMSDTALQALTL